MTRIHYLAAEIYGYSFDNYANHLGPRVGNIRFEELMPDTVRRLERAEKEGWTDARLAQAIEVEVSEVPRWRERYRKALEVVDAVSVTEGFRNGVRQSIARELKRHELGDAELESAVTQICYRVADLSYLLKERGEDLSDHSLELRKTVRDG